MTIGFAGLEIARTALSAQRKGMDVSNHNIANMNTDGYARENVTLQANTPYPYPSMNPYKGTGQIGTGVVTSDVKRLKEDYIELQIRNCNRDYGAADVAQRYNDKLESIINEPSDQGINTALSDYWQAWQELSKNPTEEPVRSALLQKAQELTDAFNTVGNQLAEARDDIEEETATKVTQLNSYAKQIATLNTQIKYLQVAGNPANGLKDQRDVLLDQVSHLAGVSISENTDGTINISLGGTFLVDGVDANAIEAQQEIDSSTGKKYIKAFVWADTANPVNLSSGELGSLLSVKNGAVKEITEKINQLVDTLAKRTNKVHAAGYGLYGSTGNAFFTGADTDGNFTASSIKINAGLTADDIAAATATEETESAGAQTRYPGNENALAITHVNDEDNGILPGYVIDNAFAEINGALGVASQTAQNTLDNKKSLTDQLKTLRDSVSGVNYDEEGANILRYQQAYMAAGQITSTIKEMLDQLILNTAT